MILGITADGKSESLSIEEWPSGPTKEDEIIPVSDFLISLIALDVFTFVGSRAAHDEGRATLSLINARVCLTVSLKLARLSGPVCHRFIRRCMVRLYGHRRLREG